MTRPYGSSSERRSSGMRRHWRSTRARTAVAHDIGLTGGQGQGRISKSQDKTVMWEGAIAGGLGVIDNALPNCKKF